MNLFYSCWKAVFENILNVRTLNTRSAGGASLPESASGGQIDRCVLYRLLIY
jgi:hypothetical protein